MTSSDSSEILSAMLHGSDILSALSDMTLAVHLELLSEVLSVEKTLIGGEGRGRIVGVEPVIDPLASPPGIIVSAELVLLVPVFCLRADIMEAVPMLPLPVVVVILSLQA